MFYAFKLVISLVIIGIISCSPKAGFRKKIKPEPTEDKIVEVATLTDAQVLETAGLDNKDLKLEQSIERVVLLPSISKKEISFIAVAKIKKDGTKEISAENSQNYYSAVTTSKMKISELDIDVKLKGEFGDFKLDVKCLNKSCDQLSSELKYKEKVMKLNTEIDYNVKNLCRNENSEENSKSCKLNLKSTDGLTNQLALNPIIVKMSHIIDQKEAKFFAISFGGSLILFGDDETKKSDLRIFKAETSFRKSEILKENVKFESTAELESEGEWILKFNGVTISLSREDKLIPFSEVTDQAENESDITDNESEAEAPATTTPAVPTATDPTTPPATTPEVPAATPPQTPSTPEVPATTTPETPAATPPASTTPETPATATPPTQTEDLVTSLIDADKNLNTFLKYEILDIKKVVVKEPTDKKVVGIILEIDSALTFNGDVISVFRNRISTDELKANDFNLKNIGPIATSDTLKSKNISFDINQKCDEQCKKIKIQITMNSEMISKGLVYDLKLDYMATLLCAEGDAFCNFKAATLMGPPTEAESSISKLQTALSKEIIFAQLHDQNSEDKLRIIDAGDLTIVEKEQKLENKNGLMITQDSKLNCELFGDDNKFPLTFGMEGGILSLNYLRTDLPNGPKSFDIKIGLEGTKGLLDLLK